MVTPIYKSTIQIRVRFSDTDAMGIVWHGNYYHYFEEARCNLLRELNLDINDVEKMGYYFPVIHCECRYVRALKYGMIIEIETSLIEVDYKIILNYIIRVNDIKMATGRSEHAVINSKSFQLYIQVPEQIKTRINQGLNNNAICT